MYQIWNSCNAPSFWLLFNISQDAPRDIHQWLLSLMHTRYHSRVPGHSEVVMLQPYQVHLLSRYIQYHNKRNPDLTDPIFTDCLKKILKAILLTKRCHGMLSGITPRAAVGVVSMVPVIVKQKALYGLSSRFILLNSSVLGNQIVDANASTCPKSHLIFYAIAWA